MKSEKVQFANKEVEETIYAILLNELDNIQNKTRIVKCQGLAELIWIKY